MAVTWVLVIRPDKRDRRDAKNRLKLFTAIREAGHQPYEISRANRRELEKDNIRRKFADFVAFTDETQPELKELVFLARFRRFVPKT